MAYGLANALGAYNQLWRLYPPSFKHDYVEQQRASNPPQPFLTNSLPAPSLTMIRLYLLTFCPVNGALYDSLPHLILMHSAPPPYSAPPDFHLWIICPL
ncbi:transcription factor C6 [Aspergillus lentulus]|nr:transcription factor C6 [Aspergillus lentulus]